MSWNQNDLSKFLIAGAQYGGPIGKQRDVLITIVILK